MVGITHSIILLSSEIYLLTKFRVISSMFSGMSEPVRGTLVIPGRSIKVKLGQVDETIVSFIGLSTIFLFVPALSSEIAKIFNFTSSKFV